MADQKFKKGRKEKDERTETRKMENRKIKKGRTKEEGWKQSKKGGEEGKGVEIDPNRGI